MCICERRRHCRRPPQSVAAASFPHRRPDTALRCRHAPPARDASFPDPASQPSPITLGANPPLHLSAGRAHAASHPDAAAASGPATSTAASPAQSQLRQLPWSAAAPAACRCSAVAAPAPVRLLYLGQGITCAGITHAILARGRQLHVDIVDAGRTASCLTRVAASPVALLTALCAPDHLRGSVRPIRTCVAPNALGLFRLQPISTPPDARPPAKLRSARERRPVPPRPLRHHTRCSTIRHTAVISCEAPVRARRHWPRAR